MDLTPFKSLIKERTGLSFGASRLVKLAEVLQSVMSAKNIDSPIVFYNLILNNQREFLELVNLLTINETYFFRESGHLKLLVERLAPDLLSRRRAGGKVRILSAGCSTGEEPYSLAMALMERMGCRIGSQFEIMGVDIDSEAILKAKKGVYGRQSFRSFDPELRDKYFDKTGTAQYKLKDFVRGLVDLKVFNLASDRFLEDLRNLDVIFYRNVSIYFEPDTQRKIFENLSRTLNEGGCFITSATETLSHNLNVLSLKEWEGVFFYQKATGPNAAQTAAGGLSGGEGIASGSIHESYEPLKGFPNESGPFAALRVPAKTRAGKGPGQSVWADASPTVPVRAFMAPQGQGALESDTSLRKSPEEAFEEAFSLAEDKKYDQALKHIDEFIARDSSFVRAYALKGNLLVNLDRLDEAERACLEAVQIDELCLEGYLLLGLIARKKEDYDTSLKRFKEALYVRPSCWLAHFYLAEIHHSRGEPEKARREYGIILNLFERGELKDPGLSLFPLTVPVEQMMHLCRHKMAHL